jgi:hypothetical protein
MKFKAPHWLTVVLSSLALIAGALANQDTFPTLTPAFKVLAILFIAGAAPTITSNAAPILIVFALAFASTGCTQAQLKTASSVDATAITDTQKICVVTEAAAAVDPVTVPYVMGACSIAAGLESAVADILNLFEAQKAAMAERRAKAAYKAYRKATGP